jgi:hypothetical protein
VSAASSYARAGESATDIVEARADYDAAAAAYDRNDYATAAVRFARADERVPNPRALRLAMASALLLSDAALAMNLVERSEQRARASSNTDPVIAGLARKLRARFEASAGRIRVSCMPETASCASTVDGEAVGASRTRWVTPGRHVVALGESGGAPPEVQVVVRAGETVDVPRAGVEASSVDAGAGAREDGRTAAAGSGPEHAAATGAAPAAEPAARSGLSPVFFWSGVAATGASVAVASILTVVVAGKHDDFVERPSVETARDGDAAQTRARVVWGVAGAFAVTTVVLGVLTDWSGRGSSSGSERARASSRPAPAGQRLAPSWTLGVGAGGASVSGSFW